MTELKQYAVSLNETTIRFNDAGSLFCYASENMCEKLKQGHAVFFTIKKSEIEALLKIAEKKQRGFTFEDNEAFFIPNSYIEIHINKELSMLEDKVLLQVQPRRDYRGLNFFIRKSENEISHSLSFNLQKETKFLGTASLAKDEYYNELHFSTKDKTSYLYVSIEPK